MSDEEVAVAVKETKMRGKRVAAHARSGESIKQCVRHGIEIIYHASFADEEALDMLEAEPRQALRRARHRHPRRHARARRAVGHHARQGGRDGLRDRAGRGGGVAPEDAQARHPRAARRRLRLRVHAALPERAGPRVLRQVRRHDADGGAAVGHALRRRDHDDGRRARPAQGRLPRRPPARRRRPPLEPRDPARPQRSCSPS